MNCLDCGITINHFDMQYAASNFGRLVCRQCGRHYEKQIQKIDKKQFMLDRKMEASYE